VNIENEMRIYIGYGKVPSGDDWLLIFDNASKFTHFGVKFAELG